MWGISFLFPAFLLGALAVALPIVLHLLKREAAPRVAFSAVRFLRRAPVAQARRKRLHELLLLALRVTALLLLAGAFARPFFAGPDGGESGVTIIAVDTSLSMGPVSRFETARTLAREAVVSAGSTERVGVLTFGDGVAVIAEPGMDRNQALAAIDGLEPGFGTADYARGLTRAAELLENRAGSIVMVTDLQRSGWNPALPARVASRADIEIRQVEPASGNLAVEDIRDGGGRILVAVRHTGDAPTTVRLAVTLGDAAAVSVEAALTANALTDIEVPGVWPARGTVEVRLDDPGGVPGDDARYRLADPASPVAVLIIGDSGAPREDAFYLVSALTADGDGRFRVEGTRASDVADADLTRHDVVAIVSTRGLERRGWDLLAAFVRDGGGALVALGPAVDTAVASQIFGNGASMEIAPVAGNGEHRFAPTDLRHPIFRSFAGLAANLGRVRFSRALGMQPPEGAQALARFDDGSAALVESVVGGGRVLRFGSDLDHDWNDFPLHPAFVPFVHEAMRHVSQQRTRSTELLVGERREGMPPTPGFVIDEATGGRVAINVEASESTPEYLTPEALLAWVERADAPRGTPRDDDGVAAEQEQGWWRYGLVLLLVALAGEGLLGARVG